MVAIPSLGKIVILAIVGIAAFLFFNRSREVGPGRAAGEIGEGLGAIGGGVQSFLSGVGTGTAQLLNPAFSLVELARQGGSLFGFSGGAAQGTRQVEQRPREAVSAQRTAGTAVARSIARESAQNPAAQTAYARALQQSFDSLVDAGRLDEFRGYFTSLSSFLTPAQRRAL